jgi:precorrin-6y C5,15-methyltransferase (decarboxylating) CbiE subunit
LEIWPDYKKKPHLFCYQTEEILTYLEQHPRYTGVALCYSGDIGFYSGARGMQERLERWQVHPVSGVSSVAYFLNRLGLPWNEVRLVSCHGQETDVVAMLRESPRICTLLGGKTTIAEIGTALVKQGKDKVKMTVGERLSYPEERIVTGYAADFTQGEWDALSLLLLEEEVCC